MQELRGRYVVVRDRDGVETLVPNQNLITNPVINWSYSDQRVRLKLPVRISYQDDPELALRAADRGRARAPAHPARPGPGVAADGLRGLRHRARAALLDPRPDEGVNNVRSDVNRKIWRLFREHGITIPVAQHEIRLEMAIPASARPPAPRRLRRRCRSRSRFADDPGRLIEVRAVVRAGPGGQNVNKVSTAVQLRFDSRRMGRAAAARAARACAGSPAAA